MIYSNIVINSNCFRILKFLEIIAFGIYFIYEKAFIGSGYRKKMLVKKILYLEKKVADKIKEQVYYTIYGKVYEIKIEDLGII